MFGNALGWALSLLLVVAVVGAISYIDRTTRPTPPDEFGLAPEHAAPLVLPDFSAVAPQAPGRHEEASGLYAQALQIVSQNRTAFDAFNRADNSETPEPVAAANQLLIRATGLAGGSIFAHRPELLIHYRSETPELTDAERLGRSALRSAMIVRRVNPAAGLSHLRAGFVLGSRLFDERVTYAELNAGLQLLAESSAAMKLFLRQNPQNAPENTSSSATGVASQAGSAAISPEGEPSSRAPAGPMLAAVEAFDAERLALTKTVVLPIAGRIRTLDGPMISRNLGNVRRWATSPTGDLGGDSGGEPRGDPGARTGVDAVWRVESVLALGRTRFGVGPSGTLGDQRAAFRLLKSLKTDPDPRIRLAAERALALTVNEFRQLR